MIRRTACLIALGGEPYRNLAIEKHLMDTLPEDTAILYLWQNDRCISIGRCQNPLYECRVDPFLSAGGHIARRLSGGGAVYQDRGALNFSFILPKTAFDIHHQLSILGMAAGAFGIQSRAMGRGDLFAAGRRFSVNAYFKAGSAALHHGTLYVDTALDQMAQFLSAGGGDLAAPNPPDTAAHTINLRTLNPAITIEEPEQALYWAFARAYGAQPAWLDERILDGRSIAALTLRFSDPKWIYPEAMASTFSVSERFPWGQVTVKLKVDGGVIRAARVFTDAMEAPLFGLIEQSLTGSPYLISAISGRMDQRLEMLSDPRLIQLAGDVTNLICGRIRSLDRQG